MKNNGVACLSFIFGAAIGSVITYNYVKSKYEQIAYEEIQSIKDLYDKKTEKRNAAEMAKEKPYITEYVNIANEHGYIKYSEIGKEEKVEKTENVTIISPNEYGEDEEYDKLSLTYYNQDAVLVDGNNDPIDNPEELVGENISSHFGEYEDDSVYVKNDERKAYIEILLDYGSYIDSTR